MVQNRKPRIKIQDPTYLNQIITNLSNPSVIQNSIINLVFNYPIIQNYLYLHR